MRTDDPRLPALLRAARTIAVVGLSPRPERPSHSVAAYLQRAGYRILPVRPGPVARILGEPVFPDLPAALASGAAIDIVNVFRRSEAVPALVDDILAVHPRLVWMQLGVVSEDSARRLEDAGIPVIMNRCLAVDHHSLLGA